MCLTVKVTNWEMHRAVCAVIQIVPVGPNSASYIIDVLALEQQQLPLPPLKQLLSDPSVTKILYDCRNDGAALWHEQQCKLQVRASLLDLQFNWPTTDNSWHWPKAAALTRP